MGDRAVGGCCQGPVDDVPWGRGAGAVPFDLSGDRLLELERAAEQEAAS